MSNKYRLVQSKLIELDDAARNEMGEELYKYIRTRVIDPVNSLLFQLHLAYEEGRTEKMRKSFVKAMLKADAKMKKVKGAPLPSNEQPTK